MNDQKTVAPALYRATEAAAYLGVSIATLWRLPNKDENFPKPIKVMGATRWRLTDLQTYINNAAAAA